MYFPSVILSIFLTIIAYLAFPMIRILINKGRFSAKKAQKIALWNSIIVGLIFCFLTVALSNGNATWNAAPAFLYYWVNKAILTNKDTEIEKIKKTYGEDKANWLVDYFKQYFKIIMDKLPEEENKVAIQKLIDKITEEKGVDALQEFNAFMKEYQPNDKFLKEIIQSIRTQNNSSPSNVICQNADLKNDNKNKAKTPLLKRIFFTLAVIIIGGVFVCVGIFAYRSFNLKQRSYDLSENWEGYINYSCSNKNTLLYSKTLDDNINVTESIYLSNGAYVRAINISEFSNGLHTPYDVFEISDYGVCEFNNNKVYLRSSKGNLEEYLVLNDYLINPNEFYDGNVLKNDFLNSTHKKISSDGSKLEVTFNEDGTCILTQNDGSKVGGTYTREGYNICCIDDENGYMTKFIVYDGKITQLYYSEFHNDSEWIKYKTIIWMRDELQIDIGIDGRMFINSYEKEHPISSVH